MSRAYEPPQWIMRLDAECDEVYSRIIALRELISGIDEDKFRCMDTPQRMLLALQLSSMVTYHGIVVCRLALVGIRKDVVK